jgi:hypothetical protein
MKLGVGILVLVLCCFSTVGIGQQTSTENKSVGNIELSTFPIHKASLLGLTSTKNPTFGIGFKGSYSNWSFYSVTFHELTNAGFILSQSESNLNYRIFDNEKLKVSVYNTFISTVKNSALYMIPTVSVGVGALKNLYFDLTPYTWGLNSDVKGYTYSALYNFDEKLSSNFNCGFLSKVVLTDLKPVYTGCMVELSPFLRWKSYRIQTRMIYQFSHQHFVSDLSVKKVIYL